MFEDDRARSISLVNRRDAQEVSLSFLLGRENCVQMFIDFYQEDGEGEDVDDADVQSAFSACSFRDLNQLWRPSCAQRSKKAPSRWYRRLGPKANIF